MSDLLANDRDFQARTETLDASATQRTERGPGFLDDLGPEIVRGARRGIEVSVGFGSRAGADIMEWSRQNPLAAESFRQGFSDPLMREVRPDLTSLGRAALTPPQADPDPIETALQRQATAAFTRRRGLIPDSRRTGQAGVILGSVMETLVPAVAGAAVGGPVGAAVLTGGAMGAATEDELLAEGIDEETAARAGLIEGGFAAAGVAAPAALAGKLLYRMATGAGINAVLGGVERGSVGGYLRSQGYEEQASRWNVLDGTSIAADTILGAVFGAFGSSTRTRTTRPDTASPLDVPDAPDAPRQALSATEYFDEARNLAIDGDLDAAYAHALLARELGEPEADGLLAQLEEDGADVDAGRAMAGMMAVEDGIIQPTQEHADAAMTLQDERHARVTTAPGVPLNLEGEARHAERMAQAEEQAANGEEIDTGDWTQADAGNYAPHPSDIDAMASEIEYARTSLTQAPRNLVQWVRRQGGISDDRGDVAAITDQWRGFRRILRADGRSIDDLAVKAWEDGFFPDHSERPTVNEFIDELREDASGRTNYRGEDFGSANAREVLDYYASRGIDTGLRGPELRAALRNIGREADAEAAFSDILQDLPELAAEVESLRARVRAMGGEISPEEGLYSVRDVRNWERRFPSVSGLLSMGDAAPVRPRRAELLATLSRSFGGDAQKLIDAGNLVVVENASELRAILDGAGLRDLAASVPNGVRGLHVRGTGKSYIVADSVSPESVRGVVLHEVGVHHAMADFVGKRGFTALTRQVQMLADNGHPAAIEAAARMERAGTPEKHRAEETLAYLVEHAPDLPLVKRIIADIRQWLWRHFPELINLTVDDVRALAVASLRRVARQEEREAGEWAEIAGGSRTAQSEALRRAEQQGFDTSTVYYHGTAADFDAFDMNKAGSVLSGERAIFLSPNPGEASYYAGRAATAALRKRTRATIPVELRAGGGVGNVIVNPTRADLARITKEHNTVRYAVDEAGDVYVADAMTALHDDLATAAQRRGRLQGWTREAASAPVDGARGGGMIVRVGDAYEFHPQSVGRETSGTVDAFLWPRAEGANVLPVYLRPGKVRTVAINGEYDPGRFARIVGESRKQGFDTVVFKGVREQGDDPLYPRSDLDQVAVLNPENIRSINARFENPDSAQLLASAREDGYQGSDTGEAREWLEAKAKGLPMDEASRMERAREQGFDVDTPLYHGTDQEISGQNLRPSGSEGPNAGFQEPFGVSLTTSPTVANDFNGYNPSGGEIVEGGNTLPVFARGRLAPREEWDAVLKFFGDDRVATQQMRQRGYAGIRYGGLEDEIVIFDPRNIRSRFAAFDPARSGESDLLASRDDVPSAGNAGVRQSSNAPDGGNAGAPLGERIVRNPSGEQLIQLLGRSDGHLRAVFDDSGMYVFDARSMIHKQGADAAGIPYNNANRGDVRLVDGLPEISLPEEVMWTPDFLNHRGLSRYLRDSNVLFNAGSEGLMTGPEYARHLVQLPNAGEFPEGLFSIADTPESRASWLGEHVVSRQVPGGEPGDIQHAFVLSDGARIEVSLGDDGNGAAAIEWTFLQRMEEGLDTDALYEKGQERLSASAWRELTTTLSALLERDMATHQRPAYVFTPYTEAHSRAYAKILERFGLQGYDVLEDMGSVYLFRDGASLAPDGRIKPHADWEPRFEPAQTADIDAAQREFYDAARGLDPARSNPRVLSEASRGRGRQAAGEGADSNRDAGSRAPAGEEAQFTVKPPKRLWRGVMTNIHNPDIKGRGTFRLGRGLYSSSNKSVAREYATDVRTGKVVGDVLEVSPEIGFPRRPLVLDPRVTDITDWLMEQSGETRLSRFNEMYPDPGVFIRSKGYDGVVMGDEVVRYVDSNGTPRTEATDTSPNRTLSGPPEALFSISPEAERYHALDPVDQALADDPDMRLATETGERLAREVVDLAKAREAAAREMQKAYPAAIKCAIRHGGVMTAKASTRGARDIVVGQGLGLAAAIPVGYGAAMGARAAADYETAPINQFNRQRDAMEEGMALDGSGYIDAPVVDPGPDANGPRRVDWNAPRSEDDAGWAENPATGNPFKSIPADAPGTMEQANGNDPFANLGGPEDEDQ